MIVALSHGYPPEWNMGGEVSLHRTLKALERPATVLTRTPAPYTFEGIEVMPIDVPDVLDTAAPFDRIAAQLKALGASLVIAQNELSMPAVHAAGSVGIPSIVSVHTPPRFGHLIRPGVRSATYRVFNTEYARQSWRLDGLVLHPPVGPLPEESFAGRGDAYTLLSSLQNKGVKVVLELAAKLPDRRFIIVRSPAEPTHGLEDLEERAAALPNVELRPRCAPEEVPERFLAQTRILLVPSRYETYGMSALEAAGYGIPSVHVKTPDVLEGIGEAAELVPPLVDVDTLHGAVTAVEADYAHYSTRAYQRAAEVAERQVGEFEALRNFVERILSGQGPKIEYASTGRYTRPHR